MLGGAKGYPCALLVTEGFLECTKVAFEARDGELHAAELAEEALPLVDGDALAVAQDVKKVHRNYDPDLHQFTKAHEYTRALNAAKLERVFAKPFVTALPHADGITALGGRLPVNLSGGLVSKGHPVGATGLSMVHEVALQLRGEAGPRQAQGAAIGLIENGGGVMGFDEACCAVTILEKCA